MRIITPKQNEKRVGENPKVRWDTAQAFKIARRAIRQTKTRGSLWINKLYASKESEQN